MKKNTNSSYVRCTPQVVSSLNKSLFIRIGIWCIVGTLGLVYWNSKIADAGQIQLSTYYPSPFGYYERLKFNPRVALTEPCEIGTVYYLAGTGLRYCDDTTVWKNVGSSVWTQNVNDIYPIDTTINPNLKVGIGTTTPTSPLHVVATEGMTPPGVFLKGADINVDGGIDGEFMIRNNSGSGTQKIFLTGTSGATPVLTVDGVAQNVGIGTTTPEFKLTLDKGAASPDGGILAIGTFNNGNTLTTSGAGTRLIWFPRKAAFRAGRVDGAQWNGANIGNYSVAMGQNTTASGESSTALGVDTTASGMYSTAMGIGTTASAYAATAMGTDTTASGENSTALGVGTTASGYASTAMGLYPTAQAYASVVLGQYNVIAGNTATWVATDPLFVIGNGTGAGSPSNAMTVLKNGKIGIGTAAPQAKFHIDVNNDTNGVNNLGDDFIVGAEGGVGIGTTPLGGAGGAALYIKESGVERLAKIVLQRSSTAKYLGIDFRRETGATEWSLMPSIEGGGSPGNFEIWEGGNFRRFIIKNTTGNTGIGTATPTGKLTIINTSNTADLVLGNEDFARTRIDFLNGDTLNSPEARILSQSGGTQSSLEFYTENVSVLAERMRIDYNGFVGIGTTNPGQRLEVNGGIKLNTATVRPNCNATTRGTLWFIRTGMGVKDSLTVCAKDNGNIYQWRTIY